MRARVVGRNRLAGQQHFHRLLARHVARQRHHRRRAEQPDIDARAWRSSRPPRRRPDRSLPPAGSRRRWRRPAPRRSPACGNRTIAASSRCRRHDLCEIGAAAIGVGAARGQFLEVVAGGKGRAVGGDHDGAHACVVRDRGERVAERREQRLRQAVAGLRPVEREDGDAAADLAQQDRRRAVRRRRRRSGLGASWKYPGRADPTADCRFGESKLDAIVTDYASAGEEQARQDMATAKLSARSWSSFSSAEFPEMLPRRAAITKSKSSGRRLPAAPALQRAIAASGRHGFRDRR